MKRSVINFIIMLLLIAGIAIAFYPRLSEYRASRAAREVIESFEQTVLSINDQIPADDEPAIADLSQVLYQDMQTYNQEIFEQGQFNLQDPFLFETPAFALVEYGIEDEVAGYLSIPRMDIKLPIYLGASKDHMALGAVSLGNTSAPTGGTNTNIVLAAHRGYNGTAMFRDIEALEKGDWVYVTNFWETLTYQVAEIKIILPTDIAEVRIQEGRELLTLITCHPYTQNYQRYVVCCERVVQQETSVQISEERAGGGIRDILRLKELSYSQKIVFAEQWIPVGIAAVLFLLLLIRIISRLCNRKNAK